MSQTERGVDGALGQAPSNLQNFLAIVRPVAIQTHRLSLTFIFTAVGL
jgi:hypothetical protein